jgi:tetratricopeptide (TPR) repeat protein
VPRCHWWEPPFLVTELARELTARGVAPTRAEAVTVGKVAPGTVAARVLARLEREGDAVRRPAQSIAVLGDEVALVRAADLAGLEEKQAREIAVRLVELGILRRTDRLTFEHPIVRDAIYGSIAPVMRAGMHATAAAMLERRGEGVERRAAHLLLTEPAGDPHVVSVLREAGELAVANGAIDTARAYLTRGLAEPPAPGERPAVLAALGHVELQVGGPDAAAHLREAAATASDRALAREEAEILALETKLFTVASVVGAATWAKLAGRLHALEDRALAAGDAGRALLGIMAFDELRRGRSVARIGELALAALEGDVLLAGGAEYRPLLHACFAGARAGHYERVYEVVSRAIEDAQRRGSLLGFTIALCCRALTFRYRDTASAAADLRIALEAAREHGWTLLEWQALNFYLLVLVQGGAVDEAQAELERAGLEGELPSSVVTTGMLSARGGVRYAQGRWRECYEDFIQAGRRQAPPIAGTPSREQLPAALVA